MADNFDLFGDPCTLPSGRRGRPSHRPSQEYANKISMLLALGWSQERIANACHISKPTLRKHYFALLKTRDIQRDRLDAVRFMQAYGQADKGNVGAMRLLGQMIEKNDMMHAAAKLTDAQGDQTDRQERIGKKEAERRAASDLTKGESDWGDLTSPGVYN